MSEYDATSVHDSEVYAVSENYTCMGLHYLASSQIQNHFIRISKCILIMLIFRQITLIAKRELTHLALV